ncbi:hypothetical protein [Macrococcoides caseolyticum]|uniref:hypothetical protein n=1 Tax=Macrococcoides caseolyticum TaxID=69966 RepID=UPI0018E38C43|nr:hypothetical protein [Macrococcus caseolyticus]
MIKVGDKFTGIYGRKEVVTSIWLNDKTVGVESGLAYSYEEVYKSWYQQQKQRADELEDRISEEIRKRFQLEDRWRKAYERADELEKRWSELVDVLKKKYEYYKVRADDESFGPIEQGKWKIAKHELLMVLKIMTDLKRGETE